MRQKGVGACFSLSLLQMLWSFQSLPSDAALVCFEGHSVIRKEVGMKVFSFFLSLHSQVLAVHPQRLAFSDAVTPAPLQPVPTDFSCSTT